LLISKYVWDRLSEQQRTWLQAAVDESVEYERQLWQKDTQAALEAVQASGVRVLRPDKALFSAQVAGMYELYDGTEVGALIERIKAYR
jgi:TRAP-type C4-dicarboxylate transport system substrate-binding protein